MRISQIELFYVSIPLSESKPGFFAQPNYCLPSWIPGFRQSEMRMYLLKLTTDSGHVGVSAMPAMGPERMSIGPLMGNYILGLNPLDTRFTNQRMQEFSYIGMRNGWVEIAFWDLIGKIKQEPIWKILGGSGGHVKPYASMAATYNHNALAIRDIVKRYQDQGYAGTKLRVKGTDVQEMVDFVGAARDAIGPDMNLMVDANQGWPVDIIDETPKWDLEFATQFAQGIEPFDISWLEEPLNRGKFEDLSQLRKATKVPIAGGEINSSWLDFKTMIEKGSLDIYQPDAVMIGGTYAGGMSVVYWLIQALDKYNAEHPEETTKLKYCPHTWTTGLGFAAALQLVGILPPEKRSLIEYPLDGHWNPSVWGRFIRGGFERDAEGRIRIPEGPGLGIEIDWKVVKRFGKRIYNGNKLSVGAFTLCDRGLQQTMYLKDKKEEQEKRFAAAKFEIPEPPF